MADIRLIVCDLDGTLLGSANEFYLFPVFRQKQEELKKTGVQCAICTGRSLSSFKRMFAPMSTMGIEANYVIANHAFIYELRSFGYFPHLLWNIKTVLMLWASRLNTRHALNEWHENMRTVIPGCPHALPERRQAHCPLQIRRVGYRRRESAQVAAPRNAAPPDIPLSRRS
jgi:hypothetical protein